MKIVVEGCAHGELEKIYDTIKYIEETENIKVDLLICCGDFQSVRNEEDLMCMNVPSKYANICSFYKYYNGELKAPVLTIFIGGNHEASNYLQELPYGGWVAPNIYYLGYAGVINIAGIRIAGLSGIYKPFDYHKGHFEISPYTEETIRSVYHVRFLEVFRLKQLSRPVDIFLSHDWPTNVTNYGNLKGLLKRKEFFRNDIDTGKLGSPPCEELMYKLKPKYYFAAHLHCKFSALIPHHKDDDDEPEFTKFLALDKCIAGKPFLQVVEIDHDSEKDLTVQYDLEWLTILFRTNHMLSIERTSSYVSVNCCYTSTDEDEKLIMKKFEDNLSVPLNFIRTVDSYDLEESKNSEDIAKPLPQINAQTTEFCEKLGIDDPTDLIIMSEGSSCNNDISTPTVDISVFDGFCNISNSASNSKFMFIPRSVEIKREINLSLPEPKLNDNGNISNSLKLNQTLPAVVLNQTYGCNAVSNKNFNKMHTDVELVQDNPILNKTENTNMFKKRNQIMYDEENDI